MISLWKRFKVKVDFIPDEFDHIGDMIKLGVKFEGDCDDWTQFVVTGEFHPGDPGNVCGPPERCWPPEPPEVNDIEIFFKTENGLIEVTSFIKDDTLEKQMDRIFEALEDQFDYEEPPPCRCKGHCRC